MSIWRRPEVVLAAIAASSLGVYMLSRRSPPAVQGLVAPDVSNSAPFAPLAGTQRTSSTNVASDAPSADPPTTLPQYQGPERNTQKATLLREALIARKAQQLSAAPSSPVGSTPEREGAGNQVGKPLGDYVSRIMQEQFLPLATECYEVLLTTRPRAAGNVALEFSILGDPAIGGVVIDVTLGAATTLVDPDFRTCITDSMYAVIIDAPPGADGSVSVEQSFELAP